MTVDLSQLLTIPEASKRTPLTEAQLRGWIDRNYLPHVRWGGRIYLKAEDLKRVFKNKFLGTDPTQ